MSDLSSIAPNVSEPQRAQLSAYLDLLLETNKTMNLTGVRDRAAAETLHVADALTLLPFLGSGEFSLADVGSGGGCPAFPLAIVRPDAQITCIEATRKKADFLRDAAAKLGLPNIQIINDRAENVARGPLRQTFDFAAARAVGTMVWVAEYCLPLIKTGGKLLCMKGPKAADELTQAAGAIRKLGGGRPIIHAVSLPGGEGHVIVEIKKLRGAESRYPRPPSEAKGKPIR